MTRKEAIERFAKKRDNAIHFPDGCEVISLYDSIELINRIYDDFENKNCKNCKFGMIDMLDDDIECVKIEAETQGIYFTSDFCCNKWESK